MNLEQIMNQCAANNRTEILMKVKRLKETSNITEVAQMLSSGDWIAIHATLCDPPVFILGRIAG